MVGYLYLDLPISFFSVTLRRYLTCNFISGLCYDVEITRGSTYRCACSNLISAWSWRQSLMQMVSQDKNGLFAGGSYLVFCFGSSFLLKCRCHGAMFHQFVICVVKMKTIVLLVSCLSEIVLCDQFSTSDQFSTKQVFTKTNSTHFRI